MFPFWRHRVASLLNGSRDNFKKPFTLSGALIRPLHSRSVQHKIVLCKQLDTLDPISNPKATQHRYSKHSDIQWSLIGTCLATRTAAVHQVQVEPKINDLIIALH